MLALNKKDGGNRKFILIECEDYADTITAERVRRVIKGVPNARDDALREGLGGSFTYCTLGKPIEIESMLTGRGVALILSTRRQSVVYHLWRFRRCGHIRGKKR